MQTLNNNLYINGKWLPGGGPQFYSLNPSTSEKIWIGNSACEQDVAEAIGAAKGAQKYWAQTSLDDRVSILKRFEQIVRSNREEFAKIISLEMGKPFWEALTEADAVADKLNPSLESLQKRRNTIVLPLPNGQSVTRFVAHGVVLVIGPFNFPAHMANGHVIPALLAGNSVILKPSEMTPGVAATYVSYWHEAGLPEGVIGLLQGAGDVAKWAVADSRVDAVCFTGSRDTGVSINKLLSATPWRLAALEMGGNNSLVVWDYKDLDWAVFTALTSAFITSGQRCTSARKLIVRSEDQSFLNAFIASAKALTVGNPLAEAQPFMGPVVSASRADALLRIQEHLLARGAKPLLLMKQLDSRGALVSPGVMDVTGIEELDDVEVFGPLLTVVKAHTIEEAIDCANATNYGLAAGILCRDKGTFDKFRASVRAGIVNWNQQLTGATALAAFGGLKQSGNHRPSGYFAADYCSSPVASIEVADPVLPKKLPPGIVIQGE